MPETIKVPKPTPPAVLDAMNTVAAHCAAVGYCGVYVGNNGGAIFYREDPLEKSDSLYREIIRLMDDAAKFRAAAFAVLNDLESHGIDTGNVKVLMDLREMVEGSN